MKALYFDCFAGASGDMIVGALLDLGLELRALVEVIRSLQIEGYQLQTERVDRCGIGATRFKVDVDHQVQKPRNFADIQALIESSSLSDEIKRRSLAAFLKIAEAEAAVHQTTIDRVHFHEVGAIDSIVDTVGAMAGLEILGFDRIACSAIRLGRGLVRSEHGMLPVPAPATALLVQGLPVYAGDLEGEFLTPTGAAILATVCKQFGPAPSMRVSAVGYGAGSRDYRGFPNALRVIAGEFTSSVSDSENLRSTQLGGESPQPSVDTAQTESVIVLETNIDDMNPQVCGYVLERALALGAHDAFVTPVYMKKNRPGLLLTLVFTPELLESVSRLVLSETTTLGVRYRHEQRRVLERRFETVKTAYGEVRVKVARDGQRTLHFQPEYEDCARLARELGVPLIEIQSAASMAYREGTGAAVDKAAVDKTDVELEEKRDRSEEDRSGR